MDSAKLQQLTLSDFDRASDAYDAAVSASDGIDRFCSSSDWILAARAAWSPNSPAWIARGGHGFAALLRHGEVLHGFETTWGLGCPLAGKDAAGLVEEFGRAIREESWRMLLLPGIRPGSKLMKAVLREFQADGDVVPGPSLRRWVARLDGDPERFLARRSAKLRANLKRSERMAREAGIEFESGEGTDVVGRAVAVERRSWKGEARTGLSSADMRIFYDEMCGRLAAKGRLRAMFARQDGEDVGYILGGVRDRGYRGFQFSFDARLERFSVGNLLQISQIRELCAEGVDTYDLGVDLPYKKKWADESFETQTVAVVRN